jgi:hypothetical protein
MVSETDEESAYTIRAVDDPIAGSILPLVEAIFAETCDDMAARARAMSELMLSVDRIKQALRARPSFH